MLHGPDLTPSYRDYDFIDLDGASHHTREMEDPHRGCYGPEIYMAAGELPTVVWPCGLTLCGELDGNYNPTKMKAEHDLAIADWELQCQSTGVGYSGVPGEG